MRCNIFTGALALSAPLVAMAAPTSSSQASLDSAMNIVSSLQSTLMQHEININSTISALPQNASEADKKAATSSVGAEAKSMTDAVHVAVNNVRAVSKMTGTATAAQTQQMNQVTDNLSDLTHKASGTVRNAAVNLGHENLSVFGGFVGIIEDFILGVEDVFVGPAPGLQVLVGSLVDLVTGLLVVL